MTIINKKYNKGPLAVTYILATDFNYTDQDITYSLCFNDLPGLVESIIIS